MKGQIKCLHVQISTEGQMSFVLMKEFCAQYGGGVGCNLPVDIQKILRKKKLNKHSLFFDFCLRISLLAFNDPNQNNI